MGATEPRLNTTPEKAIAELETRLAVEEWEVALALGISTRSLNRWRSGEAHPQRESRMRLARLLTLAEYLRRLSARTLTSGSNPTIITWED